jgi:hypothetical protein
MLVIQLDSSLDGSIANDIAMGKVLSENASAGLLLLRDVVVLTLLTGRTGLACVGAGGAGDRNVVGSKLRVVKQKSSLGSSLFLEGDFSALRVAFSGSDLDVGDLAAERSVSLRTCNCT